MRRDHAAIPPPMSTWQTTDASARIWTIVSVAWLLLLGVPLLDFYSAHHAMARSLGALVVIACYAALYLWLVLRPPLPRAVPITPSIGRHFLLLFALTALGLGSIPLLALDQPPWWLMFATIAAGLTLPTRPAAWTVTAIVVAGIAARWLTNGVADMVSLLGIGVIGFSAITMSRLRVTIAELQAARVELARLAVTEERLRIARDLHDLLGHSLSMITLKSELAGRLVETQPTRAVAEIGDVEQAARRALREVREVVAGYHQPTLADELDGAQAILAAAGIGCAIEHTAGALSPEQDALLGWLVREGVTNVIRHSRARNCTILIVRCGETIRGEVRDDGAGFPPAPVAANGATGSGLLGLTKRIDDSGGQLTSGPLAGGGFQLAVALPQALGTLAAVPSGGARR